ncbi:hypothetical protein [Jannaschia ovalis]|uniref:Uncharacterized protein n=1 Tax=Jannaschia ovalis TaxID=3038773 RepID=A0ABY8L8X7_9RHOB|nr:hypothetical protein [Jannaschia sp. GRR-S6-38]WGH77751.1 hypothetical protein P8627_12000 [Jannaschia sp. GRR-S6-38]
MNICVTIGGIPRCTTTFLRNIHDHGGVGTEVFVALTLLFIATIGLFVFRNPG